MSADPLRRIVEFLSRTAGRDKLCRSVQYLCRLLLGQNKLNMERLAVKPGTPAAQAFASRIETLEKVMASMVMCRKIMRFGRSTVTYRELVDAKSPEDAVQACALLAKACLFGFLVVDHVIWACNVGLLRFDSASVARLSRICDAFWLGEIAFSTVVAAHELRRARDADDGKSSGVHARTLVRNAVDLPLCLSFLDVLPLSTRTTGALGLFTSLMGVYETWP